MHKLIFRPYFFIIFILVISSCGGGGSSQTKSAEAVNTAPELIGLIDYAIPENTTFVTTIQATDAEGDPITYSINGPDADLLTINPTSGLLEFKNAPDYENTMDENSDGIYSINVVASDASLSSSLGIIITITDVDEVPQPNVSIEASKYDISTYSQVTVTWSSENADSCKINYNNDISIETSGSKKFYFSVAGTKKITLVCQNSAYEASADIEVNVTDIDIKDIPNNISLFNEE